MIKFLMNVNLVNLEEVQECVKQDNVFLLASAAKTDFENDIPPTACGYTNSGEDMVCCSDQDGEKAITPQKPQFRLKEKKNKQRTYPCVDHSWKCFDWVLENPD